MYNRALLLPHNYTSDSLPTADSVLTACVAAFGLTVRLEVSVASATVLGGTGADGETNSILRVRVRERERERERGKGGLWQRGGRAIM